MHSISFSHNKPLMSTGFKARSGVLPYMGYIEGKYFEQEAVQCRFDFSGVLYFRLAKPAFFRYNESLHWIAFLYTYIVSGC